MKAATRALLSASLLLGGCRATRDAVVTSYHIATAPVRFVHRHVFSDDETQPPADGTTASSDVSYPGQPVAATSPTPSPRWAASSSSKSRTSTAPKPRATPTSRTASAPPEFPTAKPVPGRAGLVYNPYDPNGGYIDVSGYTPGSKVKDPDSQKIFIVP
jgi:hypothetical protein